MVVKFDDSSYFPLGYSSSKSKIALMKKHKKSIASSMANEHTHWTNRQSGNQMLGSIVASFQSSSTNELKFTQGYHQTIGVGNGVKYAHFTAKLKVGSLSSTLHLYRQEGRATVDYITKVSGSENIIWWKRATATADFPAELQTAWYYYYYDEASY